MDKIITQIEFNKLLEKGIDNWNTLRESSQDEKIIIESTIISDKRMFDVDFHIEPGPFFGTTGVDAWYYGINFSNCHFLNCKFISCEFRLTDFSESILENVEFIDSSMHEIVLKNVITKKIVFESCDLNKINFFKQDLSGAIFEGSQFHDCNFIESVLDNADFKHTNISFSSLKGAKSLNNAILPQTFFSSQKEYASRLNKESEDSLQDIFNKVQIHNEFQNYASCFISYSSTDCELAEKLYTDLKYYGIDCWFAPKNLKPGDRFESEIENAIKTSAKLLIIISENSIDSEWVEHEVGIAIEQENISNQNILFPIRIDKSIFAANNNWAAMLRRQRHIGDFSDWKSKPNYSRNLRILLENLKIDTSSNAN